MPLRAACAPHGTRRTPPPVAPPSSARENEQARQADQGAAPSWSLSRGATDVEEEPQLKDDAGEGFGVAAAVEEAVKTPARSLKLMIFLRLRTHTGERQGWAPRRTATQTAT